MRQPMRLAITFRYLVTRSIGNRHSRLSFSIWMSFELAPTCKVIRCFYENLSPYRAIYKSGMTRWNWVSRWVLWAFYICTFSGMWLSKLIIIMKLSGINMIYEHDSGAVRYQKTGNGSEFSEVNVNQRKCRNHTDISIIENS